MTELLKTKTPRDLLRVVFRRWKLFLLSVTLFAMAVLVGSHFLLPVKYTGTTKFERRTDPAAQEGNMGHAETFDDLKAMLAYELAGYNAMAEAADSDKLISMVAPQGLPHNAQGDLTAQGKLEMQQIVRKLMRNVRVTWDVRSHEVDLVSVSFTSSNPQLAELMPNVLAQNYIRRVSDQIVTRLKASNKFLAQQVADASSLEREAEVNLVKFETEHAGSMPDDPGAIQQRVQDLTFQIETLTRQLKLAQLKLATMKSSVPAAATQPTSQPDSQPAFPPDKGTISLSQVVWGPNPAYTQLQEQLAALQGQRTNDLAIMKPAHPTIKALDLRIANLKKRLADTPKQAQLQKYYRYNDDPVAMSIAQSEVDMTQQDLDRAKSNLALSENVLNNFGPIRQQFLQLTAEVKKRKEDVEMWSKREADVSTSLKAEDAKCRTHLDTVQMAQPQMYPSSPSLYKILLVAIFGSLVFAGGVVFLINLMDRTISTPEDAKHFNLPVHAVIGEILTSHRRRVLRLQRVVVLPIVSLVLLSALSLSVLSVTLWLRYPDQYKQWRSQPVSYIQNQVSAGIGSLMDKL